MGRGDANEVAVGLNGHEPEDAEGGPVLTFQPEGGFEEAIDDIKGRGVEFPGENSEHDWGRVATLVVSVQKYENREMRFSALLSKSVAERLELARA